MPVERISQADTSVTALLSKAREEPLILQAEGTGDFAVLPLDDEVIDLLLERSPTLLEECSQIRERMKQGKYFTHEQMLKALDEETQA
jgi:hypothetical protein